MAAISDDTAALVAAQLTVAWATKTGISGRETSAEREAEVLEMYLRYKGAVREANIPRPDSLKVL